MELKNLFAQNQKGDILPGAACDVLFPNTTTRVTTLQNAAGLPLANPFYATTRGLIQFAAPNGLYDLKVSAGGISYTIRIQCADLTDFVDDAQQAAVSAEDSATTATAAAAVFNPYLGEYAAGIEVIGEWQEISDGEVYYKPAPSTVLPYTTTGAGMPEGGAFVAIGDAVLRGDLASTDAGKGAELVLYSAGPMAAPRSLSDKLGEVVSIKDFGATGDGVTNDAPMIQAAIDSLPEEGGSVFINAGTYFISPPASNKACIYVNKNNVRIFGGGASSLLFTTDDSAVPIHVSKEPDLDATPSGAFSNLVSNFVCEGIAIKGTGLYLYSGLAYSRGILLRHVNNAIIQNNFITDMSMHGICAEHSRGNFLIHGNIVHGCKYTAINFNGRCSQSIVSSNICSGSDGAVISTAIQVNGPCIVANNTVYGHPTDFAKCGGIMWGEGPYTGIGSIIGNIVKHCRFGIKSIFHGPVNIQNNTIINCMTTGGISVEGGVSPGFSVASSHNLVSGNRLVNCYPYQIFSGAEKTDITGNFIQRIATPVNPSVTTDPDSIVDRVPEGAIRVTASKNNIRGNTVHGGARGLIYRSDILMGEISNNIYDSAVGVHVVVELSEANNIAGLPSFERKWFAEDSYYSVYVRSTPPSQGFWRNGDIWQRFPLIVGQSMGAVGVNRTTTRVPIAAASGATVITVDFSSLLGAGTMIGFQATPSGYHWTTVVSVTGNNVTIAEAIPTGKSIEVDAAVYAITWHPLPTL